MEDLGIDKMFDDILKPLNQPEEEKSEFVEALIIRNHGIFEAVFEIFKEVGIYDQAFILGGFVRHSCSTRKPTPATYGDIDIYCRFDETYEILNDYFTSDTGTWKLKFENDLSKSFERHFSINSVLNPRMDMNNPRRQLSTRMRKIHKPIQLIKPLREGEIITQGTMREVLNNFDFTVIRAGVDLPQYYGNKHAIVDSDFIEHERKKRLVFKKIHCPISSLYRVIKYSKKGYKAPSKEILKLFLDWDNRPDSYREEIITFLQKNFEPDPQTGKLKPQDELEINRMYHMLRVD